jgi:hypothetical protein
VNGLFSARGVARQEVCFGRYTTGTPTA